MSLFTQAYIVDKYGPRLTMEQLAEALGLAKPTIQREITAGTFPIPTFVDGRRYCHFGDLADYIDKCWERAKLASDERAHEPRGSHPIRSR